MTGNLDDILSLLVTRKAQDFDAKCELPDLGGIESGPLRVGGQNRACVFII